MAERFTAAIDQQNHNKGASGESDASFLNILNTTIVAQVEETPLPKSTACYNEMPHYVEVALA